MALEDPLPASYHTIIPSVLSPNGSCTGDASAHSKPPKDFNTELSNNNELNACEKMPTQSLHSIDLPGAEGDAGQNNHNTNSEHFGEDSSSEVWSTPRGTSSDYGLSILGDWHGFCGRPIDDAGTMEFNRQLDHVAVWMEKWKHEEVCTQI